MGVSFLSLGLAAVPGIARAKSPLRQTTKDRRPDGAHPTRRRGAIVSQSPDPGDLPGFGVSFANLLLDYVPSLIHGVAPDGSCSCPDEQSELVFIMFLV